MITDWINIKRVYVKGAERLYPRDIDWTLAPGVNAIIGGTALGKTTFLYALQFGVFGKMVSNVGDRIEREFFSGRLTKRSDKGLQRNSPRVCVEFTIAESYVVVDRNLLTGNAVKILWDGKSIELAEYESMLAGKIGLGEDFGSVKRLQSFLLFFGESRYLIAWENLLQNEMLNLILSDHKTYLRLNELWGEAESADSRARNLSAQASRLEKDLEQLAQKKTNVQVLESRNDASQIEGWRKQCEVLLATKRKQIKKEYRLEASQRQKIVALHAAFQSKLTALENIQSNDLDDVLLNAILADPTVASVRDALEKFYHNPAQRVCPCCGRLGINERIAALLRVASESARAGNCIVCAKPFPSGISKMVKKSSSSNISQETNSSARKLQTLLFQREKTRSRITELQIEEVQALQSLTEAREGELKYLRENPPSIENPLHITIRQMRRQESVAKRERERYLVALKKELVKTDAVFNRIHTQIANAFKKYATLYLDEQCDVKFLKESELPGKRGPQIKAPHAAFFPVISGETRPSAQALSDAQRSFIDLAFRMAVLDVWHQSTKKSVTMIIETPEGAVDFAYMERVAKMIRTFSLQGHTVIITSNLNNDIFLPESMAAWPKSDRRKRILNLLEVGKPRPVQLQHAARFAQILDSVSKHPVSK